MESWNRWRVEKYLDYWIASRYGSTLYVARSGWKRVASAFRKGAV